MEQPRVDDTKQKTHVSTIRLGKLVVNLDKRLVSLDGQPVHLTGKEYSASSSCSVCAKARH